MINVNRNFYACQDMFKQGIDGIVEAPFGKTVFVFKSSQERDEFLVNKNEKEYFKVTQKEAFKLVGLLKKGTIPVVQRHSYYIDLFVLRNERDAWGYQNILLKDFNTEKTFA